MRTESLCELPPQDVALLVDEMKINEGLIYNARSDQIVGYVDIDIKFSACGRQSSGGYSCTWVYVTRTEVYVMSQQSNSTKAVLAEQLFVWFWNLVTLLEMKQLS